MSEHGGGDRTTIREARAENGRVVVLWSDGHCSEFHSVWLRHAGFRSAIPGADTGGERVLRADRPGEAAAARVEVTGDGKLRIAWSDPESAQADDVIEFEASWLRDHCTAASERARRRRPAVLWAASISKAPPQLSYETARGSDEGRLELYRLVLDHGFAFLRGVPARPGEVARLGALFGLLRPSPYATFGDEARIEDVRADPKVRVATRMSHFLGPHTDTCWRQSVTGLVCLHCLKSLESGGESLFVDGFAVAERLRERDPEAFALLSRVPINFAASVDNGDEWRALGRVISCDAEGTVVGFRYNGNSVTELDLPETLIEPVYAALASLEAVLYDRSLWLRRKLRPGDAVVLDNQRVLHGRGQFDPAAGERHLQTCHVERDEFHSNFRRLARALGRDDWNRTLAWGLC